jgi:hypothetical protein
VPRVRAAQPLTGKRSSDADAGKVSPIDEMDLFEAVGVRVSLGVPRGLTAKERALDGVVTTHGRAT